MDSLLSIVQMPSGVPVATVAIGNAKNAGILAVQILGIADPSLQESVRTYKASLKSLVRDMDQFVSQAAKSKR
jgi:5-(carboxyamino)imidazole ribonucleotide mutase